MNNINELSNKHQQEINTFNENSLRLGLVKGLTYLQKKNGHRSHQSGKRWCRIDRNLSRETRLIASKLNIKYLED